MLTGLSSLFWNGEAVISTTSKEVEDSINFILSMVGLLGLTLISANVLDSYPTNEQLIV